MFGKFDELLAVVTFLPDHRNGYPCMPNPVYSSVIIGVVYPVLVPDNFLDILYSPNSPAYPMPAQADPKTKNPDMSEDASGV